MTHADLFIMRLFLYEFHKDFICMYCTLHSLFAVTLRLIFSGKFACRYALIRDVTLNYFEKYSDAMLITVKKI